jgi:ABC-2 type transport system ATP-binding protein
LKGAGARLEGVSRCFGDRVAVDDVSFEVRPGEVLGLLGPNGAGKTTTMRLLTGYLRPSAGRVIVGDFDAATDPVPARQLVGYLPEGAPAASDQSVLRVLRFGAALRGVPWNGRRAEVDRVIGLASLEDVVGRPVGELSRGYRQRLGLAQALIGDPAVLVLDEPTSGLDPRQVAETRSLIGRLGRHHAVLLSSHLLSEVAQLCQRVVVLDRGRVIATAPIGELTAKGPERRVILRVAEPDRALAVVRQAPGVDRVERRGRDLIAWGKDANLAATVSAAVVGAGIALDELRSETSTLEDAYLKLVGE